MSSGAAPRPEADEPAGPDTPHEPAAPTAHAALARRLKAQALTELAERQVNAIARNYYLTTAQFLLKDLPAR